MRSTVRTTRFWLFFSLATFACLAVGCNKSSNQPGNINQSGEFSGLRFSLVSGSENKDLEPIVTQFAQLLGVQLEMSYMGSVDISRELEKGSQTDFDAVWPAASIWLSLGDSQGVVKDAKSISGSPVVFAVKKSIAEKLGWVNKDVTVSEILAGVEKEQLRFAMTSATQSNSGASWYLGCLSAFAGQPEVLQSEMLEDDAVRTKIREFLGSVNRSSGSSGWLKDMMIERYNRFDGMVNYEALVIETNREIVAQGKEPLYVVYPVDGLTIADSPLGLVSKTDSAKSEFFAKLVEHLQSKEIQNQIASTGRRTGLLSGVDSQNEHVFNPEWGIDAQRVLTPIRTPSADVIRQALNLSKVAFRKPSLTVYVLDYSQSMQGSGEQQLKEAMFTLLDEAESSRYLLQASPEDISVVIPFNHDVIDTWEVRGNDQTELRGLLRKIEGQPVAGGTNMYLAALHGLDLVAKLSQTGSFHTSIILMSDGESKGSLQEMQRVASKNELSRDIPIFTILFGSASKDQMEPLAKTTGGRMFDGRKDVVSAFRNAKGYN
ncbi:MAG: VWA domain-containing protein [Planctomycetales bacterium]|nr:VWA domain-containing protein [Planctomycetales bacterium]